MNSCKNVEKIDEFIDSIARISFLLLLKKSRGKDYKWWNICIEFLVKGWNVLRNIQAKMKKKIKTRNDRP